MIKLTLNLSHCQHTYIILFHILNEHQQRLNEIRTAANHCAPPSEQTVHYYTIQVSHRESLAERKDRGRQ